MQITLNHRLGTIQAGVVQIIPNLTSLTEQQFVGCDGAGSIGDQKSQPDKKEDVSDKTK